MRTHTKFLVAACVLVTAGAFAGNVLGILAILAGFMALMGAMMHWDD